MFELITARERVTLLLARESEKAARFGSALPGYEYRPELHEVVIVGESEYDFGWVFCYALRLLIETGDESYILGGNAPLIFDRHSGQIYGTGTARPLEAYIEDFRRGVRKLVD